MYGPFVEEPPLLPVKQDQKNAKILSRKQIQKRLIGLTLEEYMKITTNLRSQNAKLKVEVKNLNEKVEELIVSRKLNKGNHNPQIEQEILRHKKELDVKYESMNYLKQQVRRQNDIDIVDETRIKSKQMFNALHALEKDLKECYEQLDKVKKSIMYHEEGIREYTIGQYSNERMNKMKEENKMLRDHIRQINQQLRMQEKESQNLINKIYTLKSGDRKREKTPGSSEISLVEIRTVSLTNEPPIQVLEKQVQDLKKKKKEMEKDILMDRNSKENKKAKLQKEIKASTDYQRELYKKKVKLLNQLNSYEIKDSQFRAIRQREAIRNARQFDDENIQTEKPESPKQFRKEWIGKSQGLVFNDAIIVENRENAYIRGVIVYKNIESIVFLKFQYQVGNKKYETEVPFEKEVVKKCETKVIESKNKAELTGMIVSTNNKRINRIELKWADGDSSVIGWQTEESFKFLFDLDEHQRPICMFGTVSQVGKHTYVLQSLGCEISEPIK